MTTPFKNFRLNIVIRVIAIAGLSIAFAFVVIRQPMLFVPVAILLLLLLAVFSLIRYVEKSNKDLTHFLLSIRQGAFTESYTSGSRGKQYEEYSSALNDIISEFSKLNQQKELHYQFLEALNENISVAIMSFDVDGKLIMMNAAAKALIGFPSFSDMGHFKQVDAALYDAASNIRSGERIVVKSVIRGEHYQLGVQLKEIVLNEKPIRIILLQNLNRELEAKEIEAWQQLMRVLTHEIMNSVTPIASLSAAAESIIRNKDGSEKDLSKLTAENAEDIFNSITTIRSRSNGLLQFVKAYKEYAKPITLQQETIEIGSMMKNVVALLDPEFKKCLVTVRYHPSTAPRNICVDKALTEQVLINLLKNAIEAVSHDGSGNIDIHVNANNNTASVSIVDNGVGIDQEILPRIFVPFFTTKPNGSGIGLSLSRQIMKLHNGDIKVKSNANRTVFSIIWNF